MVVRITKKLADIVNGLDISHCQEGDVIEVPTHHARMLISEGWAEEAPADAPTNCAPAWRPDPPAVAAERSVRRSPAMHSDDEDLISRLRMGVNAMGRRSE